MLNKNKKYGILILVWLVEWNDILLGLKLVKLVKVLFEDVVVELVNGLFFVRKNGFLYLILIKLLFNGKVVFNNYF